MPVDPQRPTAPLWKDLNPLNPYGTNVFFDACVPGGGPFCHPPRKSSIHVKEVQIRVTYQI